MSSAQCRRGAKSVITHVIIHFGFIFSNRRIWPPILPNHPNPLPGPPDPLTFILLMSIILILHTRLKSAPGSGQNPDFIHTNRHTWIAQLPKRKYGKPPKGNPLKMTFEKIVRPLSRPPYVTHLEAHRIITMFGLPSYQKRKLWKTPKRQP